MTQIAALEHISHCFWFDVSRPYTRSVVFQTVNLHSNTRRKNFNISLLLLLCYYRYFIYNFLYFFRVIRLTMHFTFESGSSNGMNRDRDKQAHIWINNWCNSTISISFRNDTDIFPTRLPFIELKLSDLCIFHVGKKRMLLWKGFNYPFQICFVFLFAFP